MAKAVTLVTYIVLFIGLSSYSRPCKDYFTIDSNLTVFKNMDNVILTRSDECFDL